MFIYRQLIKPFRSESSGGPSQLNQVEAIKLDPQSDLSRHKEDLCRELDKSANLSAIVGFKPSELLQHKNMAVTSENPRKIPRKPSSSCLIQSKLLSQSEIDFSTYCKRGIKYSSSYILASYHLKTNSTDNGYSRKKLITHLKNLHYCRSFILIEGDLLPFTSHDINHIRKAALRIIKTIRQGQWNQNLKEFNTYHKLEAFSSGSLKGMKLSTNLQSLHVRQLLISEKEVDSAVKKLSRLNNLKSLSVSSENLTDVVNAQKVLSRSLEDRYQIKDLIFNCYCKLEPNTTFDSIQLDPNANIWTRLTDLNLYNFNDDTIINILLRNHTAFQNLHTLTYGEVRSNPSRFILFKELHLLKALKKLSLSISFPDNVDEAAVGISLFDSLSFPADLEDLSLTINGTKPWKFLRQIAQSRNFFDILTSLDKLKSFSLSISTYTFVSFDMQDKIDIIVSFAFFTHLIRSLPKQLEELVLSLFQPFLMSSSPLINDKLLQTVSGELKNLKTLVINFLSIQITPSDLEPLVLPKLKTLTLYNLTLPFSFLKHLDAVNIEEFSCWVTGSSELEHCVQFLREINFLTSICILRVHLTKLNIPKLTKALLLEIAKIFLNLKSLQEFNLALTAVMIEKQWAEWFVEVVQYKKSLQFCSIQFKNYHITKEYFSVSLKHI